MHATIRATILTDVIRLISQKHGWTEDEALDRFFLSATGASFSDDETGLYGQSALYVFGLFEEENNEEKKSRTEKLMQYIKTVSSPLGDILLACDEEGLTGLWFVGQKYYAAGLSANQKEQDTEIFQDTCKWLDIYFSGGRPSFVPPVHLQGTVFQLEVWNRLLQIPYGQTVTYGQIAKSLSEENGKPVSARAVGGAVGHNRVSIVIPCHRVIGANGSMTGYAGGVDRKIKLLRLEKADLS